MHALRRTPVCFLIFAFGAAYVPASCLAAVTYASAIRTAQVSVTDTLTVPPFGSTTTSDARTFEQLGDWNDTASVGSGFTQTIASLNSRLLADRITYVGSVAAFPSQASGHSYTASAFARQTIIVELSEPALVWREGTVTFPPSPSFPSEVARITGLGGPIDLLTVGQSNAVMLPAGVYTVETNMGSVGAATFNLAIRFSDIPSPGAAAVIVLAGWSTTRRNRRN